MRQCWSQPAGQACRTHAGYNQLLCMHQHSIAGHVRAHRAAGHDQLLGMRKFPSQLAGQACRTHAGYTEALCNQLLCAPALYCRKHAGPHSAAVHDQLLCMRKFWLQLAGQACRTHAGYTAALCNQLLCMHQHWVAGHMRAHTGLKCLTSCSACASIGLQPAGQACRTQACRHAGQACLSCTTHADYLQPCAKQLLCMHSHWAACFQAGHAGRMHVQQATSHHPAHPAVLH
jgi:hypothetical protein